MDRFKNYLNALSEEAIKKELEILYENFEVVRDFYGMKLSQGKVTNRLIRKYKDRVIDALYPDGSFQGGLDVDKVDKIMSTVKRNPNYFYYIQVGIYAVEACTTVANDFGGDYGEEFYQYFEELYEGVIKFSEAKGVKDDYREQFEALKSKAFLPDYPPIKVYYWSEKYWSIGITEVKIGNTLVSIYEKEKSVCDAIRYRNKIGKDVEKEVLKTYLKEKGRNIEKLLRYARILRVEEQMETYLSILL